MFFFLVLNIYTYTYWCLMPFSQQPQIKIKMPAHTPTPAKKSSPNDGASTSTPLKSPISKPARRIPCTKSRKLSEAALSELKSKTAKTQESLNKLMASKQVKQTNPRLLTAGKRLAAPVRRSPAVLGGNATPTSSSTPTTTTSKADELRAREFIAGCLKEAKEMQQQQQQEPTCQRNLENKETVANKAVSEHANNNSSNSDDDVVIEDSDQEVDQEDDSIIVDSPPPRSPILSPESANNSVALPAPAPAPSAPHKILINHGMINPIEIIDRAIVLLGGASFSNKVISDNLLIFECGSKDCMDKLLKYFVEKGLPTTVNPTDGKVGKYIIRGLNPRTPSAWIHSQLVKLGYSPKGISNITGGRLRAPTNDFRVDLIVNRNSPSILNLKRLGTFDITTIPMASGKIYQCFRCQKFDHKVNNCHNMTAGESGNFVPVDGNQILRMEK